MNLWQTVFRLEWRVLRRDVGVWMVLVFFATLLVVSAFTGGRRAQSQLNAQRSAVDSQRARLARNTNALRSLAAANAPMKGADPRDPLWMGETGATQVFTLPPSPLAAVAMGRSDLDPQSVIVSARLPIMQPPLSETPMSSPTRRTTGPLDPGFLFVVFLPLVVIALSYDLLSGERERGTLAMLLSQPLSQPALVFGKASARAALVCATTLAFALAAALLAGVDLASTDAALHLTLYAAVVCAWAVFWFACAIVANALGFSSEGNALLLIGAWLLVVVILPGVTQSCVDALMPAPSRVHLMHEVRDAAQDVEKRLTRLRGKHDVDTSAPSFNKALVDAQLAMSKRAAPIIERAEAERRRRDDVLDMLRFTTPALAVQTAIEDVAGTGAARQRHFASQFVVAQGAFRTFFFERAAKGVRLKVADVAEIPTPSFAEIPAQTLVWRISATVLTLFGMSAALLLFASRRLRFIGRLTR